MDLLRCQTHDSLHEGGEGMARRYSKGSFATSRNYDLYPKGGRVKNKVRDCAVIRLKYLLVSLWFPRQ